MHDKKSCLPPVSSPPTPHLDLRFGAGELETRTAGRKVTMSGGAVGRGKVVCVTGASGFIASWLVKLLLHRGYTVHATVTDPANPLKTSHLQALDGATERLHFFKANLLEDGSFDAAIQGCDGVFHTASPCFLESENPEVELIEPAVKGTLNVLSSCKKFSIKRVIVTSSVSAIIFNRMPKTSDTIVDETWFSSSEFCREEEQWYSLSKTLAEEAAWRFAKENGIDMITINPTMVIGPLLQPTINTSCALILMLVNGSSTYPNTSIAWVNIKDVAEAHVLAFEDPSASGRYLLNERVIHFSNLIEKMKEMYPDLKYPDRCDGDDQSSSVPAFQLSSHKAKSLGIDYVPLETSIRETIESFKEKGLLDKPLAKQGFNKI